MLDAYTNLSAPVLRGCCAIPFAILVGAVSFQLGGVLGEWLSAAYFAVYGTYCLANFIRCREAHCSITGPGWLGLAIAAGWSAAVGGQDLNELWIAFLAIAVVGHSIEAIWRARRRTGAVTSR